MYLSIVVVVSCVAAVTAGPLAPAYPSTQESLIDNSGSTDASDIVFTAKIFDVREIALTQVVDIEVGTPPQSFRALVDIGWSDAFLPSSKCEGRCPGHSPYTSSESSSYVGIGDPVTSDYFYLSSTGHSSQDIFRIGGLEIKGQVFEEQTQFSRFSWWNPGTFETPLGLSRLPIKTSLSTLKATSVWHNIIQQKLLQRNIFSLKLSKSPHQEGEIMFGGANRDLFEGELKSISLSHATCNHPEENHSLFNDFESGWQVAIKALAVDTLEFDLTGYVAIISTSFPTIALPEDMARKLFVLLNSTVYLEDWAMFDCDERKKLPDLIVRLGVDGSVPLTISPWHYVSEIRGDTDDEFICFLPLGGNQYEECPNYIGLGSAFLRGVYSVFDQDEETISFAQLKGDIPE